jgi:hypothetical protein
VTSASVGFVDHLRLELAHQNLSWQCTLDHARQLDRHRTDQVAERRRVQSLGLVELVMRPDVEAGAQLWHRARQRGSLARQRVVGKNELHELIKLYVGGDPAHPVPDVKAVTCRRPREVDVDFAIEQAGVRSIDRARQTVELDHLV